MTTTHLSDQKKSNSSTNYEIATTEHSYGIGLKSEKSILSLSDAVSRSWTVSATRYQAQPFSSVDDASVSNWALLVKRAFDIAVAGILIVGFSPILLVCSLLVVATSRGSVFYKQIRVGRNGREFSMWKLRTMYEDSDVLLERYLARHPEERLEWEQRIKIKCDPRVTPIGRVMRRFSLDEMPQFWNVLMGEMSLVGPRPITVPQIPRYGAGLRLYSRVRPGLTGLWQVSGRSATTFEARVMFDKDYVENWSLMLDFRIWLRTFIVVIIGAGAY